MVKNAKFIVTNYPDYAFHSKTHTSPLPLVGNVSLPILPKPLSILKTAGKDVFRNSKMHKQT